MRKSLLITICLTYVLFAFAGPVSEKQALAKALQFMPGKSFRSVHVTAKANTRASGNEPYYVFNTADNAGFVIVSGDDRTKAILGYSEQGAIDGNNLPENVAAWLGYYADVIASLSDQSPTVRDYTASATRKNIQPLIKTAWNQMAPYNNQCVFDGTECLTGCVATAMAQIMNFHKYPKKAASIAGYTNSFEVPALPAATLSWKNMCDTYAWNETRTAAQNKAVATLMRYCGQSVEMNYGVGGSAASSEFASMALVKYFGYNKSTHVIYRDGYTEEGWEDEIYQELAASYPIFYSGLSTTNYGHAFIVDGYKDGLYHVNWGWGGLYDGYFVLTVMDSTGEGIVDDIYSENQTAIIGIRPVKGGSLEYPKMTIAAMDLASEKVVTRSSANDYFQVPVSYKVQYSVNSEDDLVGMGFALYQGDKMVQSLMQYSPSSQRPGWYWQGIAPLSFGRGLADGNYRIHAVYTDLEGNVQKAQGSDFRYIDAKIKGNKLTLTQYPLVGVVTLNKSKAFVNKGKTITLKATVAPSSLADKSVKWKSSNKKVATVSSKGKVKGLKYGTATITCTSSTGLTATCKITVGEVTLDKTEAVVKKGKTVTLTPTVYPTSLKDQSVKWKSSNKKVATVTSKGKVKGIKAGTAIITCTSVAMGLSTTCKVTVKVTSATRSLEGDDGELTGIEAVAEEATIEPYDVYDLSGRKVAHQVTTLDGLPKGLYIVNGKKMLKR